MVHFGHLRRARAVAVRQVVKKGEGYVLKSDPAVKVSARAHKMSKSRGNVVNPDDVVYEFGADSLRLYEMFMGPLRSAPSAVTVQHPVLFLCRTLSCPCAVPSSSAAPRAVPSTAYVLRPQRVGAAPHASNPAGCLPPAPKHTDGRGAWARRSLLLPVASCLPLAQGDQDLEHQGCGGGPPLPGTGVAPGHGYTGCSQPGGLARSRGPGWGSAECGGRANQGAAQGHQPVHQEGTRGCCRSPLVAHAAVNDLLGVPNVHPLPSNDTLPGVDTLPGAPHCSATHGP